MDIYKDIYNKQTIRAVLEPMGFHFSKARGQNFLIREDIPERMAALVPPGSGVLEIGPGFGALTEKLIRTADKTVAVELDSRLVKVLRARYGESERLCVLEGNILRTDMEALAAEHFAGLTPRVCANLPYSLTSGILTRLIEAPSYQSLLLMVQREVALRLTANPGTKEYGAFTIFARVFCGTDILFLIPPEAFHPRPEVTTAVILMTRREKPLVPADKQALFFKLTRAAFQQRRKTLQNALSAAFAPLSREQLEAGIRGAGLDPRLRGEVLDIPAYAELADQFAGILCHV